MNNRLFKLLIPSFIIVMVTMIVSVATMLPLISLPISYLFLDGVISGVLLAILNFLIKEMIRYSNYRSFPLTQQIINYIALAILFVLFGVGISNIILNIILPKDILEVFLPTIPIRIVITLLIYGLMILVHDKKSTRSQDEETNLEIELENIPEIESTDEIIASEEASGHEILEHIAVKNGQKIDLIFINDIISIQAEGNYVMIFTPKGKYLKEQTMKYFGDHLPLNKFVRVHRSSFINIDYIQRIELYDKQSQILKLQNNLQVKMSLAGYRELKRVLNL